MLKQAFWIVPILGFTLSFAGCSNPADDKAEAQVGDPVPEIEVDEVVEAPDASGEVAGFGGAVAAANGALAFDGKDSKIGFIGSKVGGSHEGGFKTFTGTITLDPDKKEVTAVEATIDMKSTFTDADGLTKHLMNEDFFEVETYPEAKFTSTGIAPAADASKGATHDVTGNFTLHGVTKSITFPAKIAVTDPETTLDSEFFIKRTDFGIVHGIVGDNLINDEVVIKLALKAKASSGVPGVIGD